MSEGVTYGDVDAVIDRLRSVGWRERDQVKGELLTLCSGYPDPVAITEHLEARLKDLSLEVRWEVEEVIETLKPAPPPPAEEESEEEEPPKDGQLRMSDLDMVYDDPRGLVLYKHKTADRWFAVQPDPRSGQPQMFELHPSEVQQLKTQLKGSPYWMLGAGA